jgi:two-component system sensor histidine kinase QseC
MTTIQRRLTLILTVSCSLLGTVSGSALYLSVRKGLVNSFDGMLKARAEGLAALIKESKRRDAGDSPVKTDLLDLSGVHWPSCFELWSPSGGPIERSVSLGTNDLPCRAGPVDAPQLWDLVLPDGQTARAIGVRFIPHKRKKMTDVAAASQPPEELTLVIARRRGPLDDQLNRLKTVFVLTGVLLVLSTVGIVSVVVRKQLASLSRLARRAATIDASSLQTRFPTASLPGELQPICERLNDLLARLEASFTRERRFTTDVAHELRTPIAELRSMAEVALKYPGDALTTTRTLEDVLAVAGQMEAVSTGLLAIARCQAGSLEHKLEPINVSALFRSILPGFMRQIDARSIAMHLDLSEQVWWLCNVSALRPILLNLFSNAVEYTPSGGRICVSLIGMRDHDELHMSNTATHLAKEDLPNVFDRFWRRDSGRSATVHTGLGLPLARGLAEFLGLRLHAELSAPNVFTIILAGAQRCRPASGDNGLPRPSKSISEPHSEARPPSEGCNAARETCGPLVSP